MNEAVRDQAETYRQRAEELRTQANGTPDAECKEALHRLARGYDRLAENLDRVVERAQHFIVANDASYSFSNGLRLVSSR